VLSFDEKEQQVKVLENASILIIGDTINAIFNATEKSHLPRGTEIIQARGKIVTPGFINTHHHLWQSQYKTHGSNTTLAQYILLYSEFSQAQTVFTAEDIYYGEIEGIYESLNAGVTTIVDHASHTWSTEKSLAGFRASIDSGARVQWCFAFHDLANGYARSQQHRDFERLARRKDGSPGDWRVASLGIAYDNFLSDPPDEVHKVLALAKYETIAPLGWMPR
jgi:cytosine/adenosine deaminase-related metal-dependent hydrolase